ncbi:hypothetical protein D3C76_1497330 [compost metagenome]
MVSTPPLTSFLAKSAYWVSFPSSLPTIRSSTNTAVPLTRSFFCPFSSLMLSSGAIAFFPGVSSLSIKSQICTTGAVPVYCSSFIICASSKDMIVFVVLFRFSTSRAFFSFDTKMNTSARVSVSLLYQSITLTSPSRASSSLTIMTLA